MVTTPQTQLGLDMLPSKETKTVSFTGHRQTEHSQKGENRNERLTMSGTGAPKWRQGCGCLAPGCVGLAEEGGAGDDGSGHRR